MYLKAQHKLHQFNDMWCLVSAALLYATLSLHDGARGGAATVTDCAVVGVPLQRTGASQSGAACLAMSPSSRRSVLWLAHPECRALNCRTRIPGNGAACLGTALSSRRLAPATEPRWW